MEKVLELCTKLIRERSYSGEEQNIVKVIEEYMKAAGFDEVFTDRYGDIIGCIKGNRPGKKILMDGHIDTVPVQEETLKDWKYPPFEGTIADGKLYGRGSSDMKSAVAAMICAAEDWKKKNGNDFAGEVYVAGVVHEECFEGVAAREISKIVKPDFVIIGEASEMNLKIGQRGRAEITLEVFGKSCHSSNPQNGVNAVKKAMKIAAEFDKIKLPQDEAMSPAILELTDIISSPYPGESVVPDYCKITFDRRTLPNETEESVLEPLRQVIENMKKTDSQINASVDFSYGENTAYTGEKIAAKRFFPAWKRESTEDFVKASLDALHKAGIDSKISTYNFCTNGSHYGGEAGLKTIGFGPSKECLAHVVGEYAEINDIIKAKDGYMALIEALLNI